MSESAASLSTKPDKVDFKSGNIAVEWSKFKQTFDLYLIGTKQEKESSKVKFAQMLCLAGDHALEVYNSFKEKLISKELNAENETVIVDKSQDLDAVIAEFDKYAQERKSVTACREHFNKRNQKAGEPIANWLTDLKNRIQHCEYGLIEDSMLKDRLVWGVHDKRLKETLRSKPNLTLQEVIDVCKGVEATLKQDESASVNVDSVQTEVIRGKGARRGQRGRGSFRGRFQSGKVVKNYTRGGGRGRRPARGSQRGSFRGGRGNSTAAGNASYTYLCRKCNRWHEAANCPAYNQQCKSCGGYNHFSVVCTEGRANSSKNPHQNQNNNKPVAVDSVEVMALTKDEPNTGVIISGESESRRPRKEWNEILRLGGELFVKFKLDPGSEINSLPLQVFKLLKKNHEVRPTKTYLKAYGQSFSSSEGKVSLLTETKYGKKTYSEYLLSSVEDRPILGVEDCEKLNLVKRVEQSSKVIFSLTTDSCLPESKDEFIALFKDMFTGLGEFKHTVKIVVDPSVQPGVCPPRRYSYSIIERLKPKLDCLEKEGIIAKVTDEIPKFVSNLSIREKPNGDLRLCLDPEMLNKAIRCQKYSIPVMDEIIGKVKDKKVFSVLDMKDGFWHATLDEESSLLCSFNTPYGIYRFRKMPFGICSAPEIFQFLNDQAFKGIDCIFYFDDCLIAGKDEEEHDTIMRQVMERAKTENTRFNPNKLQYRQNEVKFLGHLWSLNKIRIDPERVEAITVLQEPKTRKQLQKLLATFNYLRKWIPQMATVAGPLYELLSEKVVFQWLPVHSQAFNNLKECVCKAPSLSVFDTKKPILIQADASQYGLGACMLQDKLPIAFASRTLTDTEKDYAQVEKEMLALSYAATKFEKFIYGMKDVLFQTDHQPLVSVFKKPLHKITNSRLKRFRLKMLKFQPKVEYLPGKYMHVADYLSRDCIDSNVDDDPEMCEVVHEITKYLPISNEIKADIVTETEKDTGLKAVKLYYQKGWPDNTLHVVPEARPYWQLRNDLFVEEGLVILEDKVVIPLSLRPKVLKTLHIAHLGADKTKAKARQAVYWPGINNDITTMTSGCRICERHSAQNYKEPLMPHDIPELRFQKVSADILDIGGNNYLAVEDNLSKWLEIKKLSSKSSAAVIGALKSIFYTHGIPEIIYGDNNPLNSFECHEFAKSVGSKIVTSSPEYPRSNGLAEKGVHIAKQLLIKSSESGSDYLDALREYNNTPLTGMDVSPSQILMSRNCRTLVPMLKNKLEPKVVNVRPVLQKIQSKVKQYYDRTARRKPVSFLPGSQVVVRRGKIWEKAVVEGNPAPRSYVLRPLYGRSIRRNTFHLKHSSTQPDIHDGYLEPYDIDAYLSPSSGSSSVPRVIPTVTAQIEQTKIPVVVLERLSLKRPSADTGSSSVITKKGRKVKPNPRYQNDDILQYS